MKLRLICIIAAAMLLVGCGGAPESGDTSEKPESTTAASTSATTQTSTAPVTVSTTSQESPLYTEQTSQGSPVGGVSLSSEHEELRSVFKSADGYCDFEDMGLQLMHCTDIEKKARTLLSKQDDFDQSYEESEMGSFVAADDGCFYFSLTFAYDVITVDEYSYWEWTDHYFCCDCDTGEVTQVILPEGYTKLVGISGDVMVVGNDDQNVIVHRESGFTQPLPDEACNIVVCDNVVFFQHPSPYERISDWVTTGWYTVDESQAIEDSTDIYFQYPLPDEEMLDWFTTGWYTVDEHHAVEGSTDVYDQHAIIFDDMEGLYYFEHTLKRGVGRILGYSSYYDGVSTMTGTSFITYDPRRRVRDMVYDTYYAGTVMLEKNLLGYRSRFSIIDDNGEEYVLGTMQTDNDYTYSSDFHATKDGVIYLNTEYETFIMLCEKKSTGRIDCSKDIVVAFAPDQLDRLFDNVFCDDEYLYFFNPDPVVLYALRRAE